VSGRDGREGAASRDGGGQATRSPVRRHPVLRIVQACVAVAALAFLILYLARSWSSVQAYDWRLRPAWLAASGLVLFVSYIMSGATWWLILRGCGLRPARLRTAATWGTSLLARYIPGTVFMFLGRYWMSVNQGLEAERVTAAMVYEQAVGVAGALVATALLFPFWHYERGVTAWSLLIVPVLVALMHPRAFAPLANLALRLVHRQPLARVLSFRAILGILSWMVAYWFVAGLGCYCLAAAVTDGTAAALPVLTVAFALGYVAGMVAFFVPSGIGVREGVVAAASATVLPGGAVAVAWAVLLRLWQVLVELVFVGVVVIAARVARRGATGGRGLGRNDGTVDGHSRRHDGRRRPRPPLRALRRHRCGRLRRAALDPGRATLP